MKIDETLSNNMKIRVVFVYGKGNCPQWLGENQYFLFFPKFFLNFSSFFILPPPPLFLSTNTTLMKICDM